MNKRGKFIVLYGQNGIGKNDTGEEDYARASFGRENGRGD